MRSVPFPNSGPFSEILLGQVLGAEAGEVPEGGVLVGGQGGGAMWGVKVDWGLTGCWRLGRIPGGLGVT